MVSAVSVISPLFITTVISQAMLRMWATARSR
jgi:hypothetical protein